MTTDLYALLLRVHGFVQDRMDEISDRGDHLHYVPDKLWNLESDLAHAIAELRSQLGPFAELRTELPQER